MPSASLLSAISQFGEPRGYLAVASIGLPPRCAVDALRADLDAWSRADRDPQGYDDVVTRTRAAYASLVGVSPERVAQGSQASVMASVIAASAPDGAEVLCIDGDFSSIIVPFLQRPGLRVRAVAGGDLASAVTDDTWLVVFSLVQSSSGAVADGAAIAAAAAAHGARTLCDTTQAVGVLPVDAAGFDATICHSYKWLCAPRGVAFMTLSARFDAELVPVQAGWYAGRNIWKSCYGPTIELAEDARRFDVSPAWQAWIGAEQSIGLFASLDIAEVWQHTVALGNALCDGLGIPEQGQAIVSWPDPSGDDLARLSAAGIRASGRAGRLRAAIHLWNTVDDVEAVLRTLHS